MERNGRKRTARTGAKKKRKIRLAAACHYNVYVVYLRNPKGDGKAGYYVGMTGLQPEQRFENHKKGIKAAAVVKKYGERLVPKLYEHFNPMPYGVAKDVEARLAEELRRPDCLEFGRSLLKRLPPG